MAAKKPKPRKKAPAKSKRQKPAAKRMPSKKKKVRTKPDLANPSTTIGPAEPEAEDTSLRDSLVAELLGIEGPERKKSNRMITTTFDIEPFVGAHPVQFGMSRSKVHRLLGKPDSSRQIWDGSGTADSWDEALMTVGYGNDGRANHIGISPGRVTLSLLGKQLWSPCKKSWLAKDEPDPNPELLRHDSAPLEIVGLLVFPKLGISTAGYHDGDIEELCITVGARGNWDDALSKATKPNLRKYRVGKKRRRL